MRFYHQHPPPSDNPDLYNQKELSHVTYEELLELRKMPKYSTPIKILQAILAIIFGIPRVIGSIVFLSVAGLSFALLCMVWRALGRNREFRLFLQRFWASLARIWLFIIGFYKVTYHGQPDPDARFMVTNHVCFLDGWFFLPFAPRPLAKQELFSWPILGDMLEVYDGIAVDRSKKTGVSKKLMENALDSNNPPVTLAPEGATTSGEYMFKFHLGAFLSDLPVQPCAIRYTLWGTSRKIAHLSFFHHSLWQLVVFLGIPAISADIYFFDPVSLKTEGEGDPRKFADFTELRIANFLGVRAIDQSNSAIFAKKENKEN